MQEEGDGIKREIEDMLVSLQFQDRTSQLQGQVCGNIAELENAVKDFTEGGGDVCINFNTDVWLENMKQNYAMTEQHDMHSGDNSKSNAEAELTFF